VINPDNPFLPDAAQGSRNPFINWDWERLIAAQLNRYPRMQVDDFYKLVFQAANGAEHALTDLPRFRKYFYEEWQRTKPDDAGPLLESIAPGGSVVRIHFAASRFAGLDRAVICEAVIFSAASFTADTRRLQVYWEAALAELFRHDGALAKDCAEFWEQMPAQSFPAAHHSDIYRSAYHPAYRLITAEVLVNRNPAIPENILNGLADSSNPPIRQKVN
jgi:hypothetical protein